MNQIERNEAYELFLNTWGKTQQMIMVLEETAELQKEITKNLRGRDNVESIIEEIADVEIMLEQLKFIFKIDQAVIDEQKESKIKRAMPEANLIKNQETKQEPESKCKKCIYLWQKEVVITPGKYPTNGVYISSSPCVSCREYSNFILDL